MKTSKIFLIIASLFISLSLFAQTPNIVFDTQTTGGTISIRIGLATAGDIQVDWGTGVTVTQAVGTTASPTTFSGTVSGTVKLYGPITSFMVNDANMTSIDVSEAPGLISFIAVRNKLTSFDVSNNPNLTTINIHTNLLNACALDYLFLSMPTITGTITLYNNSGASTSKTSIATNKGWTLSGSPAGNGTGCPATSETPNIVFDTQTTGGTITLSIGLAVTGDIQVDWGDGTRLTQTVGTTTSPTVFSGTVEGTIKLYGAITSFMANDANMVSADVSNAPNLIRFIGVRNKMTALDLSANPNVTTVSIHTNLFSACALDALFTTLPTVSTGSITFYNNAGAATSKTSIATNKGWTLAGGSLPGDGTGCISTNLLNSNVLTKASVTYSDQELKIMHSGISGSATLSVYNVSGKLVLQKNTTFEEGTCLVRTPSLYRGIYLLKIVGDQHEISEKLLISK
jgi:hypothetical protein